jgi:hypothetical protein
MTAHRDDDAGTGAVVRKPPRKETAVRDTRERAAGAIYGLAAVGDPMGP